MHRIISCVKMDVFINMWSAAMNVYMIDYISMNLSLNIYGYIDIDIRLTSHSDSSGSIGDLAVSLVALQKVWENAQQPESWRHVGSRSME